MIDWTRVIELRNEIGAEDFEEVVSLFIEETGEVVEKLPSADEADMPGLLHFLKGSAENVGFRELARRCKQGELAHQNGQAVDRQTLVDAFAASCAELDAKLDAAVIDAA